MTSQQLKNSILQIAVQGKLVPQDPGDEPASVLLERIRAEKEELIKAGKIKKDKKSSEIFRGATHNLPYAFCEQIGKEIRDISDEIPFDIPDSWEWVRIEYLAKSSGTESFADGPFGSNLKKEHQIVIPEVRIIQLSNLGEFGWRNDNVKYTSYEHLKTISRCEVEPGNFVIAKMMPAGRTVIVPDLGTKICLGSDAIKFVPHPLIYNMYLYYAMHSDMFLNQVSAESHGVTRIRTSLNKLKSYFIPIPPLAEQHRIVAKIEELLPYIEKYGKAEEHLTALNTTFPEALKKSILQEAVQGKLVPQNPDDEPASVLLERIRSEKQALIKAGKIKKDKHESVIVTRDKIPYEIPNTWVWCRLADVFYLQAGKNISSNEINNEYYEGSYACYGGNGIRGYVNSYNRQGDYPIIGRQGALCGNINHAKGNFYATEHAVCVETFAKTDVKWACLFLKALNLNQYATATAQPGIAVSKINDVLIPLPPLAEQKRIVSKIEEIMPYINTITK